MYSGNFLKDAPDFSNFEIIKLKTKLCNTCKKWTQTKVPYIWNIEKQIN